MINNSIYIHFINYKTLLINSFKGASTTNNFFKKFTDEDPKESGLCTDTNKKDLVVNKIMCSFYFSNFINVNLTINCYTLVCVHICNIYVTVSTCFNHWTKY